jgi:hypothetical protein
MPEDKKEIPVKDIFVIEEGAGDKRFWRNVGVAFLNGEPPHLSRSGCQLADALRDTHSSRTERG